MIVGLIPDQRTINRNSFQKIGWNLVDNNFRLTPELLQVDPEPPGDHKAMFSKLKPSPHENMKALRLVFAVVASPEYGFYLFLFPQTALALDVFLFVS